MASAWLASTGAVVYCVTGKKPLQQFLTRRMSFYTLLYIFNIFVAQKNNKTLQYKITEHGANRSNSMKFKK